MVIVSGQPKQPHHTENGADRKGRKSFVVRRTFRLEMGRVRGLESCENGKAEMKVESLGKSKIAVRWKAY